MCSRRIKSVVSLLLRKPAQATTDDPKCERRKTPLQKSSHRDMLCYQMRYKCGDHVFVPTTEFITPSSALDIFPFQDKSGVPFDSILRWQALITPGFP